MASAAPFTFPSFHSFPPFYTIQPVHDTRARQTQLWSDLVREYCRHHKIYTLDLQEASTTPLFSNKAIERKLSVEDARALVDEGLVQRGRAMWVDEDKTRLRVYWRTPQEWANIVYAWADDQGHIGSVCTVFELLQGDESEGQEFHGMERDTFNDALHELSESGRAQVIWGNTSAEDGVKFLAV